MKIRLLSFFKGSPTEIVLSFTEVCEREPTIAAIIEMVADRNKLFRDMVSNEKLNKEFNDSIKVISAETMEKIIERYNGSFVHAGNNYDHTGLTHGITSEINPEFAGIIKNIVEDIKKEKQSFDVTDKR